MLQIFSYFSCENETSQTKVKILKDIKKKGMKMIFLEKFLRRKMEGIFLGCIFNFLVSWKDYDELL